MTRETRMKYARLFRARGITDHPYCLEFPEEFPTAEEKERMAPKTAGFPCKFCPKVLQTLSGKKSHEKTCKGGMNA